jgi:hypothetical protein
MDIILDKIHVKKLHRGILWLYSADFQMKGKFNDKKIYTYTWNKSVDSSVKFPVDVTILTLQYLQV